MASFLSTPKQYLRHLEEARIPREAVTEEQLQAYEAEIERHLHGLLHAEAAGAGAADAGESARWVDHGVSDGVHITHREPLRNLQQQEQQDGEGEADAKEAGEEQDKGAGGTGGEGDDSGHALFCGRTTLDGGVTLDDIWNHMMGFGDSTECLRADMHATDPMCMDACFLHSNTLPTSQEDLKIVYAAFAAPPPVWARDLVFLQSIQRIGGEEDAETEEGAVHRRAGRPAVALVAGSVERDEAPHQTEHRRVRGQLLSSGYIFRESDTPGEIQLTYVVQLNPSGSVPAWLANRIAPEQAKNAGRMRDRMRDLKRAHEHVGLDMGTLLGTNAGARGTIRTTLPTVLTDGDSASSSADVEDWELHLYSQHPFGYRIEDGGGTDAGAGSWVYVDAGHHTLPLTRTAHDTPLEVSFFNPAWMIPCVVYGTVRPAAEDDLQL